MSGIKRFLAVAAIIIGILVAFISVGGVAGTWIANGILTRASDRALGGVERALGVTSESLGKVETRLEGARASLSAIDGAVTQIGDEVIETTFTLNLIENTVGEELLPRIDSARETISTVRASVVAFNNTLEAANELPFVSVPTLTDELEAASERASETRASVEELRDSVRQAKAGAVEGVVSSVTDKTSRIDDGLEALQESVADYDVKVSDIEKGVASLKSKIPFWLDVIAIVLTLWFVWVAVSQIAVIALSWSYLRTGRTISQPAPEVEPAVGVEPVLSEETIQREDVVFDAGPTSEPAPSPDQDEF